MASNQEVANRVGHLSVAHQSKHLNSAVGGVYTQNQSSIVEHIDTSEIANTPTIEFSSDISFVLGRDVNYIGGSDFNTTESVAVLSDPDESLIGNIGNFSLTLVLVSFYVVVFCLYKQSFYQLIYILSFKDRMERMAEMNDINMLSFIKVGEWLYISSASLLLSLYIEKNIDKPIAPLFVIFIVIFVAVSLCNMLRKIINSAISHITDEHYFATNLNLLYKSFYSVMALTVVPFSVLLLYSSLYQYINSNYIFDVILVLPIVFFWLAIRQILSIQKVSFLEYILYLCSAEIIPIVTIFVFLYRLIID
ncbi:MAG: DUF4271 domain-containing protein [Rikenellaceae bacterium]